MAGPHDGKGFTMTAVEHQTRWDIGQVRITQVVEMANTVPPSALFEHLSREDVRAHPWLKAHYADDAGNLHSSVHCFVIESQGRRIVVDTCVGDGKLRQVPTWNRKQSHFLADLTAAGFDPDTIDTVLCTHLHVDHVGWNTRWDGTRWIPTFPQARYLFGRIEYDFWRAPQEGEAEQIFSDSVQPIVNAGLHTLVENTHRLTDEVELVPTPGHTPGHVSVVIRSGGQEARITGDLLHHPIQCAVPDLSSRFDWDADMTREVRRRFLTDAHARGALVLGTHFAHPSAGWLVASGAGWEFRPHLQEHGCCDPDES